MPYCGKCGFENNWEDAFCSECGEPIARQDAPATPEPPLTPQTSPVEPPAFKPAAPPPAYARGVKQGGVTAAGIFGILGVTFVLATFIPAQALWRANKPLDIVWQVMLWAALALFLCAAFYRTKLFFIVALAFTLIVLILFVIGGLHYDIGFYWWLITPCVLAFACSVVGAITGE